MTLMMVMMRRAGEGRIATGSKDGGASQDGCAAERKLHRIVLLVLVLVFFFSYREARFEVSKRGRNMTPC
jgi:hypothetical protein